MDELKSQNRTEDIFPKIKFKSSHLLRVAFKIKVRLIVPNEVKIKSRAIWCVLENRKEVVAFYNLKTNYLCVKILNSKSTNSLEK